MKILLLAPHPFFQHRGTPIAVKALLEVLARGGHHVDVLTYHEGSDVEIPGCQIHRIPNLPGVRNIRPGFSVKKLVCDAAMMVSCLRMLRDTRYDLVHAVEEAAFMALVVRKLFGIPFIYDMDSSLPDQLMERYPAMRGASWILRALERAALSNSLGVLAVCKALEELARRAAPETLIATIEDPSLISATTRNGEKLSETIGRPGPIVLYVGNLEPYQGIDLLLTAFQSVHSANLIMIGGSDSDIQRYRALAKELGIGERTHFLGSRPVTALANYLVQADVLVSPRVAGNNTPMKIYSYLDSNRAVLATRLPTHTQVLDDSIAYLADATPEAFGDALCTLLSDDDLRTRLAASAADHAKRHFSQAAFARKVEAFYDKVEQLVTSRRTPSNVG